MNFDEESEQKLEEILNKTEIKIGKELIDMQKKLSSARNAPMFGAHPKLVSTTLQIKKTQSTRNFNV